MSGVPGLADLKLYHVLGQPNLNFVIDRRMAARFGINVPTYRTRFRQPWVATPSARCYSPRNDTTSSVRYQAPYRDTPKAIANIRLLSRPASGSLWQQLTTMEVKDGAYDIYREGNTRYDAVTFNVRGRDLAARLKTP